MIPELLRGLCDDAAMFPPGNAHPADAVTRHAGHRAAWYHDLVGPLLVAADRVHDVAKAADGSRPKVVVIGGDPTQVFKEPALEVVGVEVAAQDVRQTLALLDSALPQDVSGVIEVARGDGMEEALDALAASRYKAKFRTGGTTPAAFPTEQELARLLVGAVSRNLAFKCTAGLHHAVRHTDPATGFQHHGFLNILAATHVAHTDPDAAAKVLRMRSGPDLARMLQTLTPQQADQVRASFTSYGTCSISEPLEDLTTLGLLTEAP